MSGRPYRQRNADQGGATLVPTCYNYSLGCLRDQSKGGAAPTGGVCSDVYSGRSHVLCLLTRCRTTVIYTLCAGDGSIC